MLPPKVDLIEKSCFSHCDKLEEVVVSGPIWKIRSSAFTGCKMLKLIILPEGLVKISRYAFSWCISLRQITFPLSLLQISEYAFSNCRNLENANFPEDNVCERHERSFYECKNLCLSKRFTEKLFGDLTQIEKRFADEHCAISGDEFYEKMSIILLKCGHFFKRDSLLEWIKIRNICPFCKEKIGF
jgi:hypothetical protein